MIAIINTYNKNQPKILPAIIRPLIENNTPARPDLNQTLSNNNPIVLNANGEIVVGRQVIARAIPPENNSLTSRTIPALIRPPRGGRRINRTGQRTNQRDDLDLNRHSSEIELDLNRRNGSIELEVQPDPPNYWNVSEDPFGPR